MHARTLTATLTALIALLLLIAVPQAQDSPAGRNWAQWRGPHGTGVSTTANPPTEWS